MMLRFTSFIYSWLEVPQGIFEFIKSVAAGVLTAYLCQQAAGKYPFPHPIHQDGVIDDSQTLANWVISFFYRIGDKYMADVMHKHRTRMIFSLLALQDEPKLRLMLTLSTQKSSSKFRQLDKVNYKVLQRPLPQLNDFLDGMMMQCPSLSAVEIRAYLQEATKTANDDEDDVYEDDKVLLKAAELIRDLVPSEPNRKAQRVRKAPSEYSSTPPAAMSTKPRPPPLISRRKKPIQAQFSIQTSSLPNISVHTKLDFPFKLMEISHWLGRTFLHQDFNLVCLCGKDTNQQDFLMVATLLTLSNLQVVYLVSKKGVSAKSRLMAYCSSYREKQKIVHSDGQDQDMLGWLKKKNHMVFSTLNDSEQTQVDWPRSIPSTSEWILNSPGGDGAWEPADDYKTVKISIPAQKPPKRRKYGHEQE
jgi:hypothetical protein